MIYITLYGQTRCSKRRHSLAQLTQHMVYEVALTQKATIRVPRFSVSSHPPPPPPCPQCPPKVFLIGHNTVSASSFFSELSSLSGHSGGSQLVQMSHKTKRRRRRVIDGEIITAADIIGREGAESKRFIEYKLIIQFL